ncbi:hypothetical protein BUALT_Bualt09G0083300 [Buddleja alternifolia]|uniref:C2 NT-type domain-containing protein n=1 Tax=Buddleja alternifolia TaxID=168488 RepID=A0AAV6X2L8_9LAMI|nr:hypothetical protein BUALT_Bualt09G0083300 [Buddleja alternifolia]
MPNCKDCSYANCHESEGEMFKLQRPTNKQSKSRDRLDFKFSNFQALQVPKGWDRLFVSLISVETGKIIAKLGKALVKNGGCQWTDTLSESIYVSRDDSSKGYEECFVKLLVSSGSTRSSILGEATINVANYTSSRAAAAVSQPLKKCTYGTILQASYLIFSLFIVLVLNLICLSIWLQVKIQCLTPRSKIRDQEKDPSVDHHDKGSKSNGSDSSSDRTVGSRSQDSATTSRPLKLDSKETSRSASGSIQSFDSAEGSIGREAISTRNPLNNEEYNSHEKQLGGSFDGSPILDHFSDGSSSSSNRSSVNSRVYLREDLQKETVVNGLSHTSVGSSRNLLEAAENTIDELRAEAKMWERNARKLMLDLDILRKEFSDVSKKQADLVIELSAAYTEHDGLKREMEKLKLELEKSKINEAAREDPVVQSESIIQIQKVLENEIKYQKDFSADLSQQLKQSQESNIELVSVLQELEETLEQQRIEIDYLSSLKLDYTDLEKSVARNSEENRNLLIELQQVQESEKELQADVKLLEEALRDKIDELESKWKFEVSVKDEEIARLEAKLLDNDDYNENMVDLIREVESLRGKVEELEKDCTELTDENLELLFKLKDLNKSNIRKSASFDSMSSENPTDDSEVSDPKFQISNFEDELKKRVSFESFEKFTEIIEQLDMAFRLLAKPWCSRSNESGFLNDLVHIKGNTTTKMSAEYILSFLLEMNKVLETRIVECDKILRYHENEIKERDATIADAKRKMEEHEKSKAKIEEDYAELMKELEGNLMLKEQEADFFVQRQRELEAEIRLHLQEKDTLKSVATSLEDENKKVKVEMEIQSLDLKQKSEDMQKQWIGAQEQCEHLQAENKTLQASAASFVQEYAELKSEIEELHENRSQMEAQLSKCKKSLSDCTKKVEVLEDHLTSVLEEFVLKENSVKSDVDALVKENNHQKEKFALEVENISRQISDAYQERERISLEASGEFSLLLADNDALQASLQEVQSKAENKLEATLAESELKIQDLTGQLATSQQDREILMADHERIMKLLASYKKNEEKLNTDINDLELKLTISDYEREQLTKEMSILKIQLQNTSVLHEEISILKSELEGCRFENSKLEVSFLTVSGDYEKLKAENISLSEEISGFEECKRRKLAVEEKLMKMENELSVKEILCSQNVDLENELTEIKRANVQFQQKMYRLEEEKDEYMKKVQELEEHLKLMEERYNNFHKEDPCNHDESPRAVSMDHVAKNQLLENESLTKKKPGGNGEVVARERYERTKSSLETELRDLRERYLEMSLKYAEVEGEREDLVMKLRATRGVKRWFS